MRSARQPLLDSTTTATAIVPTAEADADAPRVYLKDGRPVVSSLDLARHFENAHKHVLRDIDRILGRGPGKGRSNFGLAPIVNPQNGLHRGQGRCLQVAVHRRLQRHGAGASRAPGRTVGPVDSSELARGG